MGLQGMISKIEEETTKTIELGEAKVAEAEKRAENVEAKAVELAKRAEVGEAKAVEAEIEAAESDKRAEVCEAMAVEADKRAEICEAKAVEANKRAEDSEALQKRTHEANNDLREPTNQTPTTQPSASSETELEQLQEQRSTESSITALAAYSAENESMDVETPEDENTKAAEPSATNVESLTEPLKTREAAENQDAALLAAESANPIV